MLGRFMREERGSSAAEFALVLPVFLLFFLGLIDAGRFMWSASKAEKATQVGARWAVSTDMIPRGLATYSFVTDGGLNPGDPIPKTAFPGVTCSSNGTAVSCTCMAACGNLNPAAGTDGTTAFNNLVLRMGQVYPGVTASNVKVDYNYSGLGYAGTPNLPSAHPGDPGTPVPDVSPLITVRITGLQFPLFFMLGTRVPLPSFGYSMTMEDAVGTYANY